MLEQEVDLPRSLAVSESRGGQASENDLVLAAFRSSGVRSGVAEIVDDDLRLLVANPALGAHFGVAPQALQGRLLSELPLRRNVATAWAGMARESWNLGEATSFRHVDHGTDPPRHLVFRLTPLRLDHRRLCSFSIDEVAPTPGSDDRAEVHFRHIAAAAPALSGRPLVVVPSDMTTMAAGTSVPSSAGACDSTSPSRSSRCRVV